MSQLDDFLNNSTAAAADAPDNVIDLTRDQPAPPSSAPFTGTPPPAGAEGTELASATGDSAVAVGQSPYEAPELEALLRQVIGMIEDAKSMPLSASSMINKAEVLDVLNQTMEALPDELRAARWLLKEREDFLARTEREGEELVQVARTRAEQMVQRTDLVRQAKVRARQIVEEAESSSRTMKREAEDYCDQKLASFEGVLERTMKVVTEGRIKLQGDVLAPLAAAGTPPEPEDQATKSHEFFTGESPTVPPAP